MKNNILLFILLMCLLKLTFAITKAPMASAWNLGKNPDGSPTLSPLLTEWQSSSDPNYIFYRDLPDVAYSFVIQDKETKFVPLISFKTRDMPVQMMPNFNDFHQLYTTWFGTPIFVYFGGSQSEGQVLAPTPGLIRAAHKNGTKILGSIFLSPPVFGGDKEVDWVYAMVKKEPDGHFLYADQLINIANAYHFDGYFINQESILFDEDLDNQFAAFIEYFHEKAPNMIIDWYQVPAYYTTSKFLKSNSEIFLDYGAPIQSWVQTAKSVNFPTENLEYGVNGSYVYTIENETSYLQAAKENHVSIGQFDAEKIVLQNEISDLDTALNRIQSFWNGNAFRTGVSSYVRLQSAATALPFFTDFNIGQGTDFYVKGQKISFGQWTSPELQAILPTLIPSDGFSPKYDFKTVYEGGNSLMLSIGEHLNKISYTLYHSRLFPNDHMIFRIAYQNNGENKDSLCLTYVDGHVNCIPLEKTLQWKQSDIILNTSNQMINSITLSSEQSKAHDIHLAYIYIGDEPNYSDQWMDIRLTAHLGKFFIEWDKPKNAIYFDIYRLIDGKEYFMVRTYNTFFCIDEFQNTDWRVISRSPFL